MEDRTSIEYDTLTFHLVPVLLGVLLLRLHDSRWVRFGRWDLAPVPGQR